MKNNINAFSLIEVLVSLMILSVTLITLANSEGVVLRSTRKSMLITLATLAAKNLVAELEIKIRAKGYSYIKELSEKEEDSFDDDMLDGWKWSREVKEIEFPVSAILQALKSRPEDDNSQDPQTEGILNLVTSNVEKIMKDSIREVTFTVFWPVKGGKDFSSLQLVYYLVNFDEVQKFTPAI